ncbi:hypothetical protein [Botrimarina hoheduenensis]|uniref:Uncharacterized protein n=1 Tax=Botrimarina hoheduenensis TaxID=2528000 RepID=A0A5C5VYS9_9BACT|nr:hypothetical protein [Botrimarina hoheduenensis]TWT42662.1 hypothetical protein Pla111_26340 [Botrimarina hoheduenensis]
MQDKYDCRDEEEQLKAIKDCLCELLSDLIAAQALANDWDSDLSQLEPSGAIAKAVDRFIKQAFNAYQLVDKKHCAKVRKAFKANEIAMHGNQLAWSGIKKLCEHRLGNDCWQFIQAGREVDYWSIVLALRDDPISRTLLFSYVYRVLGEWWMSKHHLLHRSQCETQISVDQAIDCVEIARWSIQATQIEGQGHEAVYESTVVPEAVRPALLQFSRIARAFNDSDLADEMSFLGCEIGYLQWDGRDGDLLGRWSTQKGIKFIDDALDAMLIRGLTYLSEGIPAVDLGSAGQGWSRRLKVNLESNSVILDQESYSVTPDSANLLEAMLKAYPLPVTASKYSTKPERLRKGWPLQIQRIVETDRHGYRLVAPSGDCSRECRDTPTKDDVMLDSD